jgi:RHS repeat-associated protein
MVGHKWPFAVGLRGLLAGAVIALVATAGLVTILHGRPTSAFPPTVSSLSTETGPTTGGTSVTITGTNFDTSSTQVSFGSVAASSVSVVSTTQLTAITSAESAGEYYVTVTTSGGTSSSTSSAIFDFVSPGPYQSVTATRICDTRAAYNSSTGYNQCSGQSLGGSRGPTANIYLAGAVNSGGGTVVPAGAASAVVVNVTVVPQSPGPGGYLTIYPYGLPTPSTSNLQFGAGSGNVVANLVEVPVNSGYASFYTNYQTPVDLIIDVQGYVVASGGGNAGRINPILPNRICDTRTNYPSNPCTGTGGLVGGYTKTIGVLGLGPNPVPNNGTVGAVAIDVVVDGASAGGYVDVYPTGQADPGTSNINVDAHDSRAFRAIVPLGSNNDITFGFYGSSGATADIVVDVNGWYTNTSATSGDVYNAAGPVRLCDTRAGSGYACAGSSGGTLGTNGVMTLPVAGHGGIPSAPPAGVPAAAILNVTLLDTTQSTYLTIWQDDQPRPTASDVNAGQNSKTAEANLLVVVQLGSDGGINIYNLLGSSDVIVDLLGYYTLPPHPSSAPQYVSGSAGNTAATVTWQAPFDSGGSRITNYTLTTYTSGGSPVGQPINCLCYGQTVTGLTNGSSYYFKVTATNFSGTSSPGYSNTITLGSAPSAPQSPTASAGNGSATVSWQAPASVGGGPITSYTVTTYTSTGTQVSQSSCSCTSTIVSGLTDGTTYYFRITATNAYGTGPAAQTNNVTPQGQPPNLGKTVVDAATGRTVSTVGQGQVVKYTVTFSNPQAGAITSVIDQLPSGLTYLPGTPFTLNGATCAAATSPSCIVNSGTSQVTVTPNGGTVTGPLIYSAVAVAQESGCSNVVNTATATNSWGTSTVSLPLTVCDTGLGKEQWWTYVTRTIGSGGTAAINVSNGNLVLQQPDGTTIQTRGHLALGLTRTYNSEDTSLVDGVGLSGVDPLSGTLGKGWTFNVSEAGDLGNQGTSGVGIYVPSVQSAAQPLAVTLIDQDGTRHTFQPKALTTAIATGGLTGALSAGIPVLTPDSGYIACIDQTYTAPAGVHLSLWRYVEVLAGSGCGSAPSGKVLGFVTERPDRLRSEYSWDGHLVDLRDGAGNEFRYSYSGSLAPLGAAGRMTAITEQSTGRALTFSSSSTVTAPWNSALTVQKLTVTDAAARVTTYYSDTVGADLLTSHLIRVINPEGSFEAYTYGGCGGSADQLCSAQDPRGNNTSVSYTSAASDHTTLPGLARVASLSDRRANATSLSYSPASASSGTTTVTEAGEQSVYTTIDKSGRVGEIDSGAVSTAALHTSLYTWDTSSAGCVTGATGTVVDNQLCALVRKGIGGTPDQSTAFTYNPEGQLLKQDQTNTPEHLITTWGSAAEYMPAASGGATTSVSDVPTGSGNVTAGTRPTNSLYYVSDRTALLSPRGNSPSNQSSYSSYETIYVPDNVANISPNVLSASTTYCSGGAATGNTGLLCEQDAPSAKLTIAHAVTRYTYDGYGERLTLTSPKAMDETPSAVTTYTYYGTSDHDLSGSVVAAGWLKAVMDPSGNFVAYAYDAAGNRVRTWDRNATAGHQVGDFPGSPGTPTSQTFAETLYGSGSDTTTAPFTQPGRFLIAQRDPIGSWTRYAVDANGNRASITPPNGSSETITQTFDQSDNLTQQNAPVVAPATSNVTKNTYDQFNNKTSTTNADGAVTAYVYDAVNRLLTTQWTRGPSSTAVTGCHTSGQSGDSPLLPANKTVCQTSTSYDSTDNALVTTAGNSAQTTSTFDTVGRVLTSTGPRPGTKTQYVYDDDGNVTDTCAPREFSEGTSSCPGGHFTTHRTFTPSGKVASQSTYRQEDLSASTPVFDTLTTQYGYDADGNQTGVTDPRGNVTLDTYSLLDRKTQEQGPRTTQQVTSWTYDAVGNLLAVTAPPASGAPAGESTSHITAYSYDADNRHVDTVSGADSTNATVATVTDSAGGKNVRTRTYYDLDDHPVAVVDGRAFAGGAMTLGTTQYMVVTTYDAGGRPSAQYVPRFDGSSSPDTGLSSTQGSQCTTSARPPAVSGVPSYNSDVAVCVTRLQRDAVGNVTQVTYPTSNGSDQRYMTASYTDDNLLAAQGTPDPSTSGGRVTTSYAYDAQGKPLQAVQPGGFTTSTVYTPDELVQSSSSGGHTTSYTYDASGNTTSTTDAAGVVTTTKFYADNRTGFVIQGSQDSTGDTYTGQTKNTTAYFYDAAGNIVRQFSPEAWASHTGSSLAQGTNTAGAPTLTTYTPDNLVATTTIPTLSNGTQGRQTAYTYDPSGSKTAQHTYLVSSVNWASPTSLGTPVSGGDSGSQTFLYDQNLLLTSETGRDGQTSIATSYDAAGNPISVQQGGAAPITATYYLDDTPRTVTDTNSRATVYSYDGSGAVTARKDTSSGASGPGPLTTYSYNDSGLPASMTSDVVSGGTTTWSYFNSGLTASQTVKSASASVLSQTAWTFNSDNTLSTQTLTSGINAQLAKWAYAYDSGSRITGQTFTGGAASTGGVSQGQFSYAYDAVGRLSSFQNAGGGGPVQAVTWDHNANRLSYGNTTPGTTSYQCYNADNSIAFSSSLSTAPNCSSAPPVGAQSYTYAPFGGVTSDGCTTYSYDSFDRLGQATGSTGAGCPNGSVTYAYDGLDRQISHTESSATTALHYNGLSATASVEVPPSGGDVAYELNPSGSRQALSQGATLQYLATDGTGNISTAVDASATIQCTARFDGFGNPVMGTAAGLPVPNPTPGAPKGCSSGTTLSDFFYRGARQDQTTQQYQFGSRTYDPSKASFLTPDSYRQAQPSANLSVGVDPLTQNTYTYVNGDPVNLVDPNGHAACAGDSQGSCLSPRGNSSYTSDQLSAADAAGRAEETTATSQPPPGSSSADLVCEHIDPHPGYYGPTTCASVWPNGPSTQQKCESLQFGPNGGQCIALGTWWGSGQDWQQRLASDLQSQFASSEANRVAVNEGCSITDWKCIVTILSMMLPAAADSVAEGPRPSLATTSDQAVFWSGIEGGADAAAGWAAENGGVTLETTLEQRGMSMPQFDRNNPESVRAWERASLEFARGAQGNITVLQGNDVSLISIWRKEYQALKQNPNVTSITAVNPAAGYQTLLWLRQ